MPPDRAGDRSSGNTPAPVEDADRCKIHRQHNGNEHRRACRAERPVIDDQDLLLDEDAQHLTSGATQNGRGDKRARRQREDQRATDRQARKGDRREIGGTTAVGYFRARSLTEGGYVTWVLRLVEIGAEGEGSCADVVEISRPDGFVDITDLGLTLAEAKLVLAGVQREIVAAQARD